MVFSRSELRLLSDLARGQKSLKEVNLDKSRSQLYNLLNKLRKKHLLTYTRGKIELSNILYLNLLLENLARYPNLIEILSDSGITILMNMAEPKSLSDIERVTGIKKSMIYRKIGQCTNSSILTKNNGRYTLNEKIWPGLKGFLLEFKKYIENIDDRVPVSAKIYYKNQKEIIFSSEQGIDAEPTAFSAYSRYGIHILTPIRYYYLPKSRLSKRDVFLHSLLVAEKEFDYRNITYIALFYMKHKKELGSFENDIFKNIKEILIGKTISGYPPLKEIKEKAEQYGIK